MTETVMGERRWTQWREAALVTAGCFLAALAMAFVARAAGDGPGPWLANGLLLGAMLRHREASVAWWLPCVFAADAAARLLAGATPPLAAAFAFADLVEVALAWTIVRRLRGDQRVPAPVLPLGAAILTLLLAPLSGAGIALPAQQLLSPPGALHAGMLVDGTLYDGMIRWWLGHATGLLVVAPVAFLWDTAQARRLLGVDCLREFSLFVLLVLGAAFAAGWVTASLLLVVMVLMLAACRIGVLGTALLDVLATAMVTIVVALRGRPEAAGLALTGYPAVELGFAVALASLAPLLVAGVLRTLGGQRDEAMQRESLASQRMRVLTEHGPGLFAQVGRDLRYRFVSRGWLQWHGKREEEILDHEPRQVFGEALAQPLVRRMARALSGETQQFDVQMPGGRALRARYVPQYDAQGAIEGFYMLGEDISWRGQTQQRFDALLAAADALLLVAPDGRIVEANDAAMRLFGKERHQLLAARLTQLFADLDADALEEAMERLRQPLAGVVSLRARRQGGEFPLELRLSEIPEEGGRLYAASFRDTGEQAQLARSLHTTQALAQVTLDAVGDAVVACDGEGRITLFNPIAAQLTGWPRAEAMGQPLARIIRMVDGETGTPQPSPLERLLAPGPPTSPSRELALLRRDGVRSPIDASAAPVRDGDDVVVGGVMVFHDVSETRAMAMKMAHLAQHDYLTDLPNRVLLHDRLSQALAGAERGAKGALLFVDLDFFKNINDTLGHQAGDKVLQEVAKRLVDAVRSDDTVSRQGGDEFVLLLVRLADPADAARVAEKLIQAVEQPYHVEGQVLRISASIGIALFPQDARDIKTLMKQADTALYHAKEAGRGRYSYFTGVMSERADQRMRTEHDLRFALANNDFFLAYQPKVLLPEARIIGMEALVRWRRSDTGEVVPPGDFIPVAEETGLIVALDEWVMQEACRQNRAWQDQGLPAVPVSVNVSLARFDPARLIAHVRATLARTGMDPRCLEIEFTESQMFSHLERAQDLIAQLKELGVQVAVDDFGTGYSSLGYLMRYKFDALKIDRSFVQGLPDDPKHRAIVQAIVGMARALDYRVVAEGVENSAQAEALQRQGCHEMQGFLYSRPLPAAEFAALLARGSIGGTADEAFPRRA